jgi:hypothetical protein
MYDPAGRIFPKKKSDLRAKTTIDIFQLDERRRLVRRRKQMIAIVIRHMKEAADLQAGGQRSAARRYRQCIWDTLCTPCSLYAGATRAVWAAPQQFGI